MPKSPVKYYRVGLLDAVNGRESLAPLLSVAGEKELLLSYARGRIAGEKLARGPRASHHQIYADAMSLGWEPNF